MFNFPSAPVAGQVYTPPGGRSYWWRGDHWARSSGTALAHNRVVNPAMQIGQAPVGDGNYLIDQWALSTNIPGNSYAWINGPTPNGSYAINLKSTVPKPSLSGTDYHGLAQVIEGLRMADFLWGTPQAKQVVLRFWFWPGRVGTYAISINNAAFDRSYVDNFVVTQVADWQSYTFVIPGDATGTWTSDNTLGLYFYLTVATSGDYVAPTRGWQAGGWSAVAGVTNNVANTNDCWLGDVGLYADPRNTGVAPEWEMPMLPEQMALCRRYWQRLYGMRGTAVTGAGSRVGTTHSVEMRIHPAFALRGTNRAWDGAANVVITALGPHVGQPSLNFSDLEMTAAGLTQGRPFCHFWTTADDYIAADARM